MKDIKKEEGKEIKKTITKTEKKISKKDEILKEVNSTLDEIETKFGEGSIITLGGVKKVDIDSISTGSIGVDEILGVGGVPRGRVIEIYGPESSGKTTLTLHIIAEAQKKGGIAAFIDAEHALDPDYAKKIGVNLDELLVSQPNSGEQALDIVESLVRGGKMDVIVIDSVAALTPRDEIEGNMGDYHVGKHARLMSQALRKLTSVVANSKTVVIFINQIRMKIGVMFGSPETTTGGNALKFYSSVRIDIRRIAQIKKGDDVVGGRHRVKIVKNKVAAPFKQTEFDLIYNEGISQEGEIIALGEKYKLVEKRKATYWYIPEKGEEEKMGVGYDKTRHWLKDNNKAKADLLKEIRKRMKEEHSDKK